MVVGQLQWAARMICFEEAFEASRLASTLGAPTVKVLQDGNAAIRRIQKRTDLLIKFSAGLNLWETMVINVADSAFDNLPKHRSQRGHFIMIGDQKINIDHSNKYKVHCIGWQSVFKDSTSGAIYSVGGGLLVCRFSGHANLDEVDPGGDPVPGDGHD